MNNEPAFPACDEANTNNTMGITIRDYFAAKAMQSIMIHPQGGQQGFADMSAGAYEAADAMMEARKEASNEQ